MVWTRPIYHVYFLNRWVTGYVSWFVIFTAPYFFWRLRKFRSSEEYHAIANRAHASELKAKEVAAHDRRRVKALKAQIDKMRDLEVLWRSELGSDSGILRDDKHDSQHIEALAEIRKELELRSKAAPLHDVAAAREEYRRGL